MSDPILPSDPQEVWIVVKPSGAIVHECQPYRTEARALERRRASANERVIGPFRHAPEAEQRRPTATYQSPGVPEPTDADLRRARAWLHEQSETVEKYEPEVRSLATLIAAVRIEAGRDRESPTADVDYDTENPERPVPGLSPEREVCRLSDVVVLRNCEITRLRWIVEAAIEMREACPADDDLTAKYQRAVQKFDKHVQHWRDADCASAATKEEHASVSDAGPAAGGEAATMGSDAAGEGGRPVPPGQGGVALDGDRRASGVPDVVAAEARLGPVTLHGGYWAEIAALIDAVSTWSGHARNHTNPLREDERRVLKAFDRVDSDEEPWLERPSTHSSSAAPDETARSVRRRCFGCLHFDNEVVLQACCTVYDDGHHMHDVDARGHFLPRRRRGGA